MNGVSQQPDALRFDTQCAAQENAYPSVVEGLSKRLPTEHVASTGITGDAKTFVHTINRESPEQYTVIIRDSAVYVFDLNGVAKTVEIPTADGSSATDVDYLDTDNADTAIKALTIADVTYITNTEKTTAMASDATPSSVNDYEALVFIQQAHASDYRIEIKSGGDTAVGTATGASTPSTHAIAAALSTTLDADGPPDVTITGGTTNPILYITHSAAFTITVSNTHHDDYIRVFTDKTQKFTDLPTIAKDGMILKVEGAPDDVIDDYYVKFVTFGAADEIGNGTWEECAGPAIASGLKMDAGTMPHILIRQANGTFVFKRADGTNHTSGVTTYDYSAFNWGNRLVGDLITNPNPSFFGQKINNIFLFKNRLGMLAGENIVMSEAGEYFNFFRFTIIDLLDTAVIDIASASSKVAVLRTAVSLVEKLVVMSDSAQFILQGDGALSPRTVSIAQATAYDALANCEPISTENSVFFGFGRGNFSGVREYISTGIDEIFEGADISSQVPKYIPGNITKIAGAAHESIIVCTTDGDPDALYVYNYYNTPQARVQSAWHRFEFGTGAKILDIEFVDTYLYLTIYRAEGIFIEKMAVEIGRTDSGATYVSRLDRRVDQAACTVSTTSVTLPYQKTAGRDIEIITKTGERIPVSTQTDGSAVITSSKDMTGVNFWVGEAYTMSYTFSDLTLREATQTGGMAVITDGRIQLRYATLTFGDSGYFRVEVTPDYRDTSSFDFTGRILGAGTLLIGSVTLESGEFRFPVFSKANQVGIAVKNDTPMPCNLLSAEYEMQWNPRTKRGRV